MSETNSVSPLRQRTDRRYGCAQAQAPAHAAQPRLQLPCYSLPGSNALPDTATPDEVRRFQLYLIESGASICNRNRIMTGVRFLFRVTLRRHDLAAEVWHIKEPPEAAASAEP